MKRRVFGWWLVVMLASLSTLPLASHAQTVVWPTAGVTAPNWRQLNPEQKKLLLAFAPRWNRIPPRQRQKLLRHAQRWAQLPPQRQLRIEQRLQRWMSLNPQQRARIRYNLRRMRTMSPRQRQRLREAFARYQRMSPQQRQILRQHWREMSPGERDRWLPWHGNGQQAIGPRQPVEPVRPNTVKPSSGNP